MQLKNKLLKLPDKIPPKLWELWRRGKLKISKIIPSLKNRLLITKIKLEKKLKENKKMIIKNKNKILEKINLIKIPRGTISIFKNISVSVFILMMIFGQIFSPSVVQAATYSYAQGSWADGANTATTMAYSSGGTVASNGTVNNFYSSSNITAGENLQLASSSNSFSLTQTDNSTLVPPHDNSGYEGSCVESNGSIAVGVNETDCAEDRGLGSGTWIPGAQGGFNNSGNVKNNTEVLPAGSAGADADVRLTHTPKTVIYVDQTMRNGNFGGRSGADAICAASANKPATATLVHAFISVNATDEIRDMHVSGGDATHYNTNSPIYWYKAATQLANSLVANNWADMLDNSISTAQNTGTGLGYTVWTGSSSAGALAASCSGWTSTTSVNGEYATYGVTNSTWLDATAGNCAATNVGGLRCIANIDPYITSGGDYTSFVDSGSSNPIWNTFQLTKGSTSGGTGSITVTIAANDSNVSAPTFDNACGFSVSADGVSTLLDLTTCYHTLVPGSCDIGGYSNQIDCEQDAGTWTEGYTTPFVNGRYLWYKATLSGSATVSPLLQDVNVNVTVPSTYSTTGNLISSPYDTTRSGNVITSLSWTEDATLPSGTGVTVSLRTASTSGGLTGAWTDFTNACGKVGSTVTCDFADITAGNSAFQDGSGDEWVQYKVAMTSTGTNTPTVDDITINYGTVPAATGTPDMTVGTDSGSSSTDNITSDATPDFTISCETGTTVTLYDNVTSVGTGACASSTVTITATTLSAGTHATMNAKQTDAVGTSVASGNLSVDIDTTADAAPGTPDMTAGTDLGSSSTDNTTSDTTPDFTMSCVTGSTVTLYDNVTSVGTGACASSTVTITATTLSAGTHATMNAKQTDAAGNVSVASSNLSITIDTTAPTQTVSGVDISTDTGTSTSDFNTNTATQTITGTLSGTLAAGEILYGSVNDGGTWTDITSMVSSTAVSWIGATLSGSSNIIFKITDLAGNDSVGGLSSVTYTTSGTWIVPDGVTSITIDVRGGGGGGGGGGGDSVGGDGGNSGLPSAIKRASTTLIQARGGDGGDGGMSEFEDPGGDGGAGGTNTTGGLTLSALAGGVAGGGGSSSGGEHGFIGQNGDKITGNYTPVTPGESLTIIVGAGGAGGYACCGGAGGGDGTAGQVILTYTGGTGTAYVLDTTAPSNQNTVLAASAYKQSEASVTIVSSGDATNAVWLAPTGTTVFSAGTTMTTAGGTATSILAPSAEGVYYLYVIDLAGNISSASTATISIDSAAPTSGSISINGGANYSTSPTTLTLSATDSVSGLYQMRFSNDDATWSDWETYDTSKSSWSLTSGYGAIAGDGLKTVYAQFKDNAENTSSSVSDTTTIDTIVPTSVITTFCNIGGNGCTSAGASASPQEPYDVQTVSGTAADTNGSGVGSVEISIKDTTANVWYSGSAFVDPSETYLPATGTTTWSYDFSSVPLIIDHTYLVHAKAIDAASNEQTVATALSFKFVNSSPTVSNVTAGEDANGVVTVSYDVTDFESSQTTNSLFYKNSEDVFVEATSATGTGIGSSAIGTGKTITWTARNDADGFETGSGVIKVVANDGASANMIGSMESSTFVLDAADPVGTLVLDVNAGTATLTGTDLSTITYLLQNGSSVTSGTSATVGSNAWTFSGETNKTVSATLSDPYGNQTSITAVAPATPTSFQVKDITNLPAGVLGEALSWATVANVAGSTAESYEIWRATDSGASALLTTVAAANNTYSDLTVLNNHTYIYKVRALDTDGDYGDFSIVQSIAPSAVAITSVLSSAVTSSSATITWTTDSFSNSVVQYGTSSNPPAYGATQTGSDGNTKSHSVTLTGLTPNTPYYFKVQSTDGSGNTSTNDNEGIGHPFTTLAAFDITATTDANGTISPSGVTSVQTGGEQTYTITPSAGYTIATLTVDGSVISNVETYTFTNVVATHTIDVTFSASTYNITATAGANGAITPLGDTPVTSGGSQVYTITPDAGYSVATLVVDGISLAPAETYTFSNVVATHTIDVTFTNVPFPTVGFSSALNQESEDVGIANIPVSVSSAYPTDVTVQYSVTDGTTLGSGVDYTLASGTLTIPAGDTTANIVLVVTDDSIFEQTETFTVTLSNPSNSTLGNNTVNTFSILDNDIAVTHADSTVKATSATVTWTTATYTDSLVEYGTIDPGNDPENVTAGAYNLSKSNVNRVLDHSVYLGGLTPTTPYYVRTTSTDADGATTIATSTFTTTAGPIISGVSSSEVTDTTAVITWTTDLPATSYVNHSTDSALAGPTRFGTADLTTTHSVTLTGLASGTTIYYYVDGTDGSTPTPNESEDRNPANNDNYYSFSTGTDQTPPIISDPTTPVITNNQVVIIWDTNEDATSQVQYGLASGVYDQTTTLISIPLKSHLVAIDGLTARTTYYYVVISTDANGNTSTSPEKTFETVPSTSGGGSSGVAQDIYDALLEQNKAYSAKFGNDTSVPVVSNIQVSGITPFGATVSFETSKDTIVFIDYGKEKNYGSLSADSKWAKVHTIILGGLSLGTEYNFKITAMDLLNNLGYSENQTFTTKFLAENFADLQKIDNVEQFQKEIESTIQSILPSLVPPFIDTPTVTDITENSATINFRTNVKSYPIIDYVTDANYDVAKADPYDGEVSDVTKKTLEHSVVLSNLKSNTKYHVMTKAFSLPQVIGKSADFTFTTAASKIQASILGVKKDSFTVVWTTDEPTSSIVEYKDLSTGITNRVADSAADNSHSVNIAGLTPGTRYEVSVSGIDAKGNTIESGAPVNVTTSIDVAPPKISNLKVDSSLIVGLADKVQTIISWQTDEPSTSVVNYAEGSGSANAPLTNKQERLEFTLNHVVILTSLKAGTVYRFTVESTDGAGNTVKPPIRTIVTPQQTASIMDIIFKNFDDTFKFINNIK
jgi:hypothetical protein